MSADNFMHSVSQTKPCHRVCGLQISASACTDALAMLCADSGSTSSDVRVDLDATDRYGFVMPAPGDRNAPPASAEPAARDRDVEMKRIAKWRKMLGRLDCSTNRPCPSGAKC